MTTNFSKHHSEVNMTRQHSYGVVKTCPHEYKVANISHLRHNLDSVRQYFARRRVVNTSSAELVRDDLEVSCVQLVTVL